MKIISFDKLPICDIIQLIDYYNLTQNQICALFKKSNEDISTIRYMIAEGFGRSSLIDNIEHYRPYINDPNLLVKVKTNKISKIFDSIPYVFVNACLLCEKYEVSIATLKQSKRFDRYKDRGNVTFKTVNGTLMVKRERIND